MNEFLSGLSGLFLPALLGVFDPATDQIIWILPETVFRNYALFAIGLIAVFLVIQIMTDSGALGLLEKLCGPILEPLGIPRELISFMIMRPVSGSGTLAIIENIAQTFGPDSFLCRCASVMMGSSETLLYAVAVYFGATRVSSLRHTIPAGVAGYAAGIWLSIVLCKIM